MKIILKFLQFQRDENFAKEMSKRGLIIKEMEEDGACLFRAISFQLYGDQDMHEMIRQQTMDYIVSLHRFNSKRTVNV